MDINELTDVAIVAPDDYKLTIDQYQALFNDTEVMKVLYAIG